MLYCFICGINSFIDTGLSIVLTFHVPNPNSLARVFITFWFPFQGFGWRFITNIFYGLGLLVPHPTPNLEDQGAPLCLVITHDLSGMGGPTSSNTTASIGLRATQASPLQHSRDSFRVYKSVGLTVKIHILEGGRIVYLYICHFFVYNNEMWWILHNTCIMLVVVGTPVIKKEADLPFGNNVRYFFAVFCTRAWHWPTDRFSDVLYLQLIDVQVG